MLVGGTPQTAQLDTAFANPLQVELANSDGCPITTTVTGTPVTFTAPASGASATFAASGSNTLTVGTDATGSASVQMLTANDTPGSLHRDREQRLRQRRVLADEHRGRDPRDDHAARPDQPARDRQQPLQPAARRARARRQRQSRRRRERDVQPRLGRQRRQRSWRRGGGRELRRRHNPGHRDDQRGRRRDLARVRANATSGTFTATASVAHVTEPARFTLDNLAAKPHTITPVGSSSATATIGTHYARRLRVTVRSAAGKPVAGVTVTFTLGSTSAAGASAGSGGAGATFTGGSTQATATTGRARHRDLPPPHRQRPGRSASPRPRPRAATERSRAVPPAQPRRRAIDDHRRRRRRPSRRRPATRFAIPLAVTVTDAHGNKVPDVARHVHRPLVRGRAAASRAVAPR